MTHRSFGPWVTRTRVGQADSAGRDCPPAPPRARRAPALPSHAFQRNLGLGCCAPRRGDHTCPANHGPLTRPITAPPATRPSRTCLASAQCVRGLQASSLGDPWWRKGLPVSTAPVRIGVTFGRKWAPSSTPFLGLSLHYEPTFGPSTLLGCAAVTPWAPPNWGYDDAGHAA